MRPRTWLASFGLVLLFALHLRGPVQIRGDRVRRVRFLEGRLHRRRRYQSSGTQYRS